MYICILVQVWCAQHAEEGKDSNAQYSYDLYLLTDWEFLVIRSHGLSYAAVPLFHLLSSN